MAITEYIDSIERANWAKHGERASVKDFGAVSDGVADCSAAFQDAYDSMVAKGGGSIDIPGVGSAGMSYKLNTPINLNSAVPVSFYGQGYSSKITRGANLPAGKGLFNLTNAKHVLFRNFLVDGMVTASTGLLYSDFAGNPVNPTLTANTTFWVTGGEDIEWDGVYIEHTGGYAAYLDGVKGARFLRCILRNNRPHTMGTVVGDLNYGSPTGGIFYYNQGGVRVDGLTVRGCVFERNTGRCVWGTSASGTPHQQVHVDNNKFTDFGLEAVLLGYTVGGSVNGNSFRRGGYITGNDAGAGAPRRHPTFPSKAIATFGATRLVPCSDNSMVSINGTAIFGDGYGYGIIAGNTIRVPRSGDPEYAEDSIGSGFAAKAIGIELWNSQGSAAGATGVSITGNTLDNLDGNAIGLHATRKCDARGNLIIMAAGASSPPIVIGGTAGSNGNATENLVIGNTIHHAPAAQAPAVFEDPSGRAFTPATDQNNVFNNYCVGANVFEFQRDPNSTSTAALFYTTSFVATSQSRHGVQREGTGEGSVLRWYAQDGDPFGWIHMGLQMYRAAGARCPLLNVSETGPGMDREGGCITTGKVTQLPYGDAMATSKLSVSGFVAFGDATYWEDDANLLPSIDIPDEQEGWVLLRWDHLLHKWQQSVSGGGAEGPRVWTDFAAGGAGGLPGPPHLSVQFNNNNTFAGSEFFTFDPGLKLVTITADAGTLALHAASGYIRSQDGFVTEAGTFKSIQVPFGGLLARSVDVTAYVNFTGTPGFTIFVPPTEDGTYLERMLIFYDSEVDAMRFVKGASATTYANWKVQADTFHATGGDVITQRLTAHESVIFTQRAAPPLSEAGQVRLYADTDGLMYISTDTAPWGPFGQGLLPGGLDGNIQYNYAGVFGGTPLLNWDRSKFQLKVRTALNDITGLPDRAAIEATDGWIFSNVGFVTDNPSGNSIVSLNGGVRGIWLHANESLIFQQIVGAGPELSHDNETRLYANANGQMYISTNKAPWGPFGAGAVPGGPEGAIQFNEGGRFAGESYFYWDNRDDKRQLWVTTHANQFGIQVTGGWIQSEGGFLTNNASPNCIQAPLGGFLGKSITFTQVEDPNMPNLSGPGEARIYADTDGKLYISKNTGPWAPFAETPAGLDGDIQFNDAGKFGGMPELYWDKLGAYMKVTTKPETGAGIQLEGGWMDSEFGYLSGSFSGNAFQAQNGGVHTKWVHANESVIFQQIFGAGPELSHGGEIRLYASNDGKLYFSSNTGPWTPLGGGGGGATAAGISGQVQYNKDGVFGADAKLTWNFNSHIFLVEGYLQTQAVDNPVQWVMYRHFAPEIVYYVGIDASVRYFIQCASYGSAVQFYITPGGGDGSGTVVSTPGTFQGLYVNAVGGAVGLVYNAIQAASAGVTGRWLVANESLILKQGGEPARSDPGQVRIYANSNGVVYLSTNTAAYGPWGITLPGGTNSMVQFNLNGTFGATGNFVWDNTNFALSIGGGSGYIATNTVNNCHFYMHRPGVIIYFVGVLGDARYHIYDASNGIYDLLISPSASATSVVVTTPGWYKSTYMEASGGSYSTIHALSGGVSGQWLTAKESLILKRLNYTPTYSDGTEVRIFASTNGVVYISTATGAWVPFGQGATPGGDSMDIQWHNGAGGLGGNGNLQWNNMGGNPGILDIWGYLRLSISGGTAYQMSSQSGSGQFWIRDETRNNTVLQIVPSYSTLSILVYTAGYFESSGGFNSQQNTFNTFRSTGGGGISVACLRASYYTHIGASYGQPGMMTNDSLSYGCMYYDNYTGTVKVYTSGGWRTLTMS